MTMRALPSLLFAGLLVACGGGGGAPTTSDQGPGPTADELRAQAMLEGCGADAVDVLLDTLGLFRVTPGATGLPLKLRAIEGQSIPFDVDLDDDMQDDLRGVLTFVDAMGTQFLPFTQQQLDAGTDSLLVLLSTLPDRTRMRVTLTPALEIGLENAELAITFFAGVPVSVSGIVNYAADPCFATLTLTDVSTLAWIGEFPALPVSMTLRDGVDVLEGVITMDGTGAARVEAALNGGAAMALSLDLATGAVALPGQG